jgi:hypothetical protein
MPGFHGGKSQQFELEVRAENPYTGKVDEDRGLMSFYFSEHNATYRRHSELSKRKERDETRVTRWLPRLDPPIEDDHFLVQNLTQLRSMSSYWYLLNSVVACLIWIITISTLGIEFVAATLRVTLTGLI